MSGAALIGAYACDLALGDPVRWHPVAGFGQAACRVEQSAYAPSRWRGTTFAAGLVAAAALAGDALRRLLGRQPALLILTWIALGGRSLVREARGIAAAVGAGDIEAARSDLPALVGRDTAALDESGVCRAAVESVAENTADGVVGALLWAAVAGPGGVAAYRAANTLDAMVGHRNERYERFGWAAARLDDVMSWPGARVAALLSVACCPVIGGSPAAAWRTLRRDGGAHPSPNAGWIEAAFAGALGVRLGGPLTYGGLIEMRPPLGDGPQPDDRAVRRATVLSQAVGLASAALCTLAPLARRNR